MSSGGFEGLEDFVTNKLGWKIYEHIGQGYINPKAAQMLQVTPQPMEIPETKIFHMRFDYVPLKSRWEQIMEEMEDANR